MRKTKIVITMGPALQDSSKLREILLEADAVRLNASHGDPESRAKVLSEVRAVSLELGRHIPIFLDLQGPKWRIGLLDEPVQLEVGSTGVLHSPGNARAHRLCVGRAIASSRTFCCGQAGPGLAVG
ncbi:MAG: hypothetical protein IPP78_14275 [Holophagaceae bacterium]|nr:hypothetical protein [Holophagaceae bacterium]